MSWSGLVLMMMALTRINGWTGCDDVEQGGRKGWVYMGCYLHRFSLHPAFGGGGGDNDDDDVIVFFLLSS